ncbi:MAG TPA: ABC transporter permease [Candidatus Acidoferrales bacterium]
MKRHDDMLAGLDQDIREHLDAEIEDNVARGMNPEEARRAALLRFGNVARVHEETREVWINVWLERLLQDVRFGLRMLRKSPGFTAAAVLTLALGLGACTAVFSLVDAVLLKPLPYPHAERIVFPWRLPPQGSVSGYDKSPWGRTDFFYFSQHSESFESWGAFRSDSFNLTGAGDPVRLDGLRASAGFFPSLGVSPSLGRVFTEEEDFQGRDQEVILSDALWREKFSGDPQVLGHTLELNGVPHTIIGVMPRGFDFPRAGEMPDSFTFAPHVQLWVPLALDRGPAIPAEPWELAVIGRLRSGVGVAQAQAELDLLTQRLEAQTPNAKGAFSNAIMTMSAQVSGGTRRPLLFLLAAVGVVLLIACANVAGLLLTRAIGRRRELALRSALGAAHSRLVRQLVTESLLLAGIGGAAGLALTSLSLHFLKILGPAGIPRLSEATVDVRVFLFAFAVTILTGVVFGLAPTVGTMRSQLVGSLKEGSQRSGAGAAGQRTRNFLLVAQVALALVLVVAAGLLTRTFFRLLAVDPGFRPQSVLTFELSLPAAKYKDQAQMVAFYTEALRKLHALPGIESAGVTEIIPMDGATENTALRIPGRVENTRADIPFSNYTVVSPDYFAAVGNPILRGRAFFESDNADSVPVTIISQTMAQRFWPGQSPIGQQVGPRSRLYPTATIVGIAADVKRISLREAPPPEMYVPYTQKEWPSLLTMDVVLRSTQEPASAASSAREAIHSIDPDLPLANMRSMASVVSESMSQARFAVMLLGAFGALALILATIGMYGVISYSVAQRTQEIGIRLALGAQRAGVLRMVIGHGARLALLGIAIGLAAAFVMARLIGGFLYGVQPSDPLTFAAVSALLLAVGLVACYIPARRATRVDPLVALRYE